MNIRLMPVFKKLLLILVILCCSGCATVYNPATGRQELILIDTPTEVALGRNVAKGITKEYTLSRDPSRLARLKKIGTKIASVSDRSNLTYHFHAVEDEELNAFALPGGYVYINTGLMDETTDDELACVLGHELGHVAARHSIKVTMAKRMVILASGHPRSSK